MSEICEEPAAKAGSCTAHEPSNKVVQANAINLVATAADIYVIVFSVIGCMEVVGLRNLLINDQSLKSTAMAGRERLFSHVIGRSRHGQNEGRGIHEMASSNRSALQLVERARPVAEGTSRCRSRIARFSGRETWCLRQVFW